MANRPSRKFTIFPLFVLIAAVCLVPLVSAYMLSFVSSAPVTVLSNAITPFAPQAIGRSPSAGFAGSTATTTTVTPSAATITLGDTVTFTATVSTATGTPSGLVTFFDGATPLGSGTLNGVAGNDQANFSTSLLSASASPHSITATYQGDATFNVSTSSIASETVNARTSATGVVLNPTTVVVGQSSTATVTVTDSGSVPSGTPDVFAPTGAPTTGRTGFTATLFGDGLVLVAGGADSSNNVLKNAEIYSVTGTTFSGTGNLNTARTGALAVLLPNGLVLVAGGSSDGTATGALNTAELFNPTTGTFAVAGSGSSNQMTAARFGATATLLNTGKVLLSGGENSGGALTSAELYDPAADTFTATGNLNAARTGHSATLLANGKVLVAGGSSNGSATGALNTAELFDPAGNSDAGTFTSITGASSTLSGTRWQPEAALLLSGKVLIAGGENSGGATASADIYDPVANTFTGSNHSMSQVRANGSAVTLPNGMVLLAGGTTSQAVDLYDPENDQFDATGSLQQSDNGLVSTILPNGQVLVVGLTTAVTPASDAELYTPSFNPLGTVTVTSSDVANDSITGVCTLTPSTSTASTCTSTVTPTAVDTNPHTITGTYPADAVHVGSNNTASLTVTKATTTTTVMSSSNPSVFGQSVTFTATVTDTSAGSTAQPTGSVQFVVDGVNFGSPVTLTGASSNSSTATSQATVALSVAGSPHTVTANYVNADGNFTNSSSNLAGGQTVTVASTTTTVSPSSNPSVFGQSVTFMATVTDSAAGSTAQPTGAVQFVVDGVNFGSPVTLTGASSNTSTATSQAIASLSVTGSPHTVKANYVNADGSFTNSSGNLAGGQAVTAAGTTTTVASSPNPSIFGQPVSFMATVTNNSTSPAPTGAVQFVVDGVNFGSPVPVTLGGGNSSTATSSATATLSVTGSPHTVKANYVNADGNFTNSSGSLPGGQTVTAASTTTTVASSSNPSTFGQSVTFTATVTDNSGGSTAVPTGAVQFVVDGVNFGSPISLTGASSNSSSATSPATATLSVVGSPHTVKANYVNADGNFSNSNGTLAGGQAVTSANTTTTVVATHGTITLGDTEIFTATVTVNAPGTGTPTGLVTFFDGSTPIGSGKLVLGGGGDQATFATSVLAVGIHSITAIYDGDASFNPSPLSAAISETVNQRGSTTGVALNPTTVVVGQPSTATVTVTDTGSSVPSGTPDAFVTTGAPATGRTGFTLTLFGDGLVLVAGGTDSSNNVLKSAEIYSVTGAAFTGTGNLNTARTGAVAVLLPNGKVLVAGGSSDGTTNGALNTAELFDPTGNSGAGTFTATSHNMTAARFATTATLLSNGKVLLAGGQNSGGVLNSAELYDPAADTFTATGNLNTARSGASATGLGSGRVLIAGGSSDGTANGALNTGELFDPTGNSGAGTFIAITGPNSTLSANRWQPEAAFIGFTRVLIAGGQNSDGALASGDIYDERVNEFSAIGNSMAQARANGSAVAMPNGMVLLAGGTTSKVVDLFDTDGGQFTTTGSLQNSDSGLVGALLNNGRVVVVGLTTAVTPASDAELYTPSFNPLGQVQVISSEATDNVTAFCTLTISNNTTDSTCTSTVTPVNVATSPHVITGQFRGSPFHSTSTGTANLTVNKADTITTITGNTPNPSVANQPITISVSVTAKSPGAGTPTGTVLVSDGVGETCTVTLNNAGTGNCSLTPQVAGTDTLTASYNGDPNYNTSNSAGVSQTVNTRHTSTTVVLNPASVVVNQTSTVTVTVTDDDPDSADKLSPKGTVSVTSNSGGDANPDTIVGSACTLVAGVPGVSSCQVTVKPNGKGSGTHTIFASYSGSNVHTASNNNPGTPLTVNTRQTATTVALNPTSVVVNQASTVTVTVTDNDADSADKLSPAGTITVTSDSGGDTNPDTIMTSPCTLVAGTPGVSSCQVTVRPNGKGSGTHTIFASYSGSDVHTSSNNNPGTSLPVTTRHTKTTVALSLTTVVVNQTSTVTVTVTDDDADNTDKLSPAGTATVTSDSGGDTNPDTIITSPCTLVAGAPGVSSCQVTVKPNGKGGGTHTILAAYSGSDVHTSSNNNPGTPLTVNTRHTSTAVALSLTTVVVNQTTTVTITVTDDDSDSADKLSPAGAVSVTSNSGGDATPDTITTSPCTLVAGAPGVSTCHVMVNPNKQGSGTHTIFAAYSGSDVHTSSNNNPGTPLTVNTRHTSTVVSFSVNPVKIATQLTVTVAVTDDDPNGTPLPPTATFPVTSSEATDNPNPGSCVLSGTGKTTTCTTKLTAPNVAGGSHTITANYPGGDDEHTLSPGSSVLTVQPADTLTTIISTTSPQNFFGQMASFTATVQNTDAGSTAAPTGSVQFLLDGTALGPLTLLAGAGTTSTALLTTDVSKFPVGPHAITVQYLPDTVLGSKNFVAGLSGDAVAITIDTTINTHPGQTIDPQQLTLDAIGSGDTITFTCTVQLLGSLAPVPPSGNFPTCSLDKNSATLPNTVTVTIKTQVATAELNNQAPFVQASASHLAGFYALGSPLAGLLGLVLLGRSRKRRWTRAKVFTVLGLMLMLSLLIFVAGCGGGGFNNPNNLTPPVTGSTQAGSYVVTITGTDHNQTVMVVTIPVNVQF